MNQGFSIDRILRTAFEIYRERLGRLLGTAAIVYLGALVAIFALVLGGAALGSLVAVPIAGVGLGLAIGFAVMIAAAAAYSGSVIRLVEAHQRGAEPASITDTLNSLKPRLWPMIWVQILFVICFVVGLLLLIIPGIYLAVIWSVILPVVVIEGLGGDSFGRSRALVKGNGWGVFGIGVVYIGASLALNVIITLIQMALGQAAAGFVSLATTILTVPVVPLLVSCVYFELIRVSGQSIPGDSAQGSAPSEPPAPPLPPPPPPAPPISPA